MNPLGIGFGSILPNQLTDIEFSALHQFTDTGEEFTIVGRIGGPDIGCLS
jgi:hypothetical protein